MNYLFSLKLYGNLLIILEKPRAQALTTLGLPLPPAASGYFFRCIMASKLTALLMMLASLVWILVMKS